MFIFRTKELKLWASIFQLNVGEFTVDEDLQDLTLDFLQVFVKNTFFFQKYLICVTRSAAYLRIFSGTFTSMTSFIHTTEHIIMMS